MKKAFIILSCALLTCANTFAQVLQENELALVYYMPQTLIDIDITYSIQTEEAGPYSRYAEKYLGTEDVITVNSQQAEILSVNVHTRSRADLSRPFKVTANEGTNMMLLNLQPNGILYGYNLLPSTPQPVETIKEVWSLCRTKEECQGAQVVHTDFIGASSPADNKSSANNKPKQPIVPPMLEEQLKAATPAQKADAIAKLIYRIREAKMYLLSGEIENAPADGSGLQVALKELTKQEKQLVQLFTGKRTKQTLHKTITYLPTKSEETPLLYFSLENGITAEEDASALPIMINFLARKQVLAPDNNGKKKPKDAPQPSAICYNLPGTGIYTITFDGATLLEGTIPVAQFGIAVPLPKNLFIGNNLPHIYFNTETGNISTISKDPKPQLTTPN